MEDAYATAPQNSAYRKEHDEERKLQAGQCIDKLEQGDEVVVESLNHTGNHKLPKLSDNIKIM